MTTQKLDILGLLQGTCSSFKEHVPQMEGSSKCSYHPAFLLCLVGFSHGNFSLAFIKKIVIFGNLFTSNGRQG